MASARRRDLEAARSALLEDVAFQKQALGQDSSARDRSKNRFTGPSETVEDALKHQTVGLVHLDDFERKRQALEEAAAAAAAKQAKDRDSEGRKKKRDKKKAVLSFDGDEDDAVQPPPVKRAKVGKDPTVSTSFLPDQSREEEERRLRVELEAKFFAEHERRRLEPIQVVFSYWDGTGHRHSVEAKKGDTIGGFLEKARTKVADLQKVNVDNLMFVVDDLIIPHHHSFIDFLVNKTRGRTGQLFDFDNQDDSRTAGIFHVERDESRAGKVCQRSWYSKNRHIWPANRWELFNPDTDYSKRKEPLVQDTRHYV